MNSQDCLKLLNLSPDSTDQDIKLAYRKAVKQWHPDRHQQASTLVKEKAEKQMQALNTAYSILTEFYAKHGYLPGYIPPETKPTTYSKPTETNTNQSVFKESENDTYQTETHYEKPFTKKKSSGVIWFTVLLIGIAFYYSFSDLFSNGTEQTVVAKNAVNHDNAVDKSVNNTNTASSSAANEQETEKEAEKPKGPFAIKEKTSAFAPTSKLGIYEEPEDSKYFTYGDTGGRVFEIQGVPTKTVGDIWYYGQSEVHFQNGRVKSWVKSDNNLKVKK